MSITAANVLHSDMQRLNNASSPAAIESKTPYTVTCYCAGDNNSFRSISVMSVIVVKMERRERYAMTRSHDIDTAVWTNVTQLNRWK